MNKLLLLLSFGFGAVITVPDDYSTIQAGIDAAAIGDTVVVYPDLYNENLLLINLLPSPVLPYLTQKPTP